jgi:transposase
MHLLADSTELVISVDTHKHTHTAAVVTTATGAALSVRLAARRSAVQAAGDAQRQLDALVIAAPEILRERLRIRSTRQLVGAWARLRVQASWEVETAAAAATLGSLARRIRG